MIRTIDGIQESASRLRDDDLTRASASFDMHRAEAWNHLLREIGIGPRQVDLSHELELIDSDLQSLEVAVQQRPQGSDPSRPPHGEQPRVAWHHKKLASKYVYLYWLLNYVLTYDTVASADRSSWTKMVACASKRRSGTRIKPVTWSPDRNTSNGSPAWGLTAPGDPLPTDSRREAFGEGARKMAPETDRSDPNIEDLGRRYRALLMSAQSAGPDDEVWKELAETRKALGTAKQQREEEKAKTTAAEGQTKTTSPVGTLLGAETTGLEATTALGLQPVPTGIYHLLDPATDPLLTVTVKNESHEPRRVCVTAYLEGLSAKAIKTFEMKRMERQGQTIPLLPSLCPRRPGGSPRCNGRHYTSWSRSSARPRIPGPLDRVTRHVQRGDALAQLQLQRRDRSPDRRAARPDQVLRSLGHATRRTGSGPGALGRRRRPRGARSEATRVGR